MAFVFLTICALSLCSDAHASMMKLAEIIREFKLKTKVLSSVRLFLVIQVVVFKPSRQCKMSVMSLSSVSV
jgi:hypothetical protein